MPAKKEQLSMKERIELLRENNINRLVTDVIAAAEYSFIGFRSESGGVLTKIQCPYCDASCKVGATSMPHKAACVMVKLAEACAQLQERIAR